MQYILIHGLGQDSSSWKETVSHMNEQDHILCPELSLLLKDKEVTYENLYNAFSEYCDKFLEPLNLCGLSLGGVVALNYAINNPGKVNSLVLIAAQYHMPKALIKVQNVIFKFIPEKSFSNMGMKKKDFLELTSSMMNLDFSNDLKSITCPVMVVCGDKDNANKKASKNLAEIIENAELKFIKDAKHEVNIDAPKELSEIIKSFYNNF